MNKIIKTKKPEPAVHTHKGKNMGLDPERTEEVDKLLAESRDSGKPVMPLHETPRDVVEVDRGNRKGFFYMIYKEPANSIYKGFAKRQMKDAVTQELLNIEIETDAYETLNECGKVLQWQIDATYIGYGLHKNLILTNNTIN